MCHTVCAKTGTVPLQVFSLMHMLQAKKFIICFTKYSNTVSRNNLLQESHK